LAVSDGVQNINSAQQILVAEDLTAAAQHDHPTQRDLVQEDLAAEEVHLVPHYNKHVKGVTKETVEVKIVETPRPGPAWRRTPRSNPMVDADAVEETTAKDRDAYVEEFHKTEGGVMLCCDVRHKVLRTQTAYSSSRTWWRRSQLTCRAPGSAGGRGADQVQQQVLQG
jgi:hypothetical protein